MQMLTSFIANNTKRFFVVRPYVEPALIWTNLWNNMLVKQEAPMMLTKPA